MSYKIKNNKLKGTIHIPPSKSYAHRAILCASLARGRSIIHNVDYNDDIEATIKAMKALGTIIIKNGDCLEIDGTTTFIRNNVEIDCKQSGSTLRFVVPLSLIYESQVHFVGEGELGKRPMNVYYDIFEKQGIGYLYRENVLDLYVRGRLRGGEFFIPGDISSQFISGLLFALPMLDEDSRIVVTSPLESKNYVHMTIEVLKSFGIEIKNHNDQEFIILGQQVYKPSVYSVEGDYSLAANYIVANALGNDIKIIGLNDHSIQSDAVIGKIIDDYHYIDGSQCIDIVPILSLYTSLKEGQSIISSIDRLKYKESNRLNATLDILNTLGCHIEYKDRHLYIQGESCLSSASVSSYHDHRMAMMIAIASSVCDGDIIIDDIECVKKSYPMFFEHFKQLGGEIDEYLGD